MDVYYERHFIQIGGGVKIEGGDIQRHHRSKKDRVICTYTCIYRRQREVFLCLIFLLSSFLLDFLEASLSLLSFFPSFFVS
ncbi:hypothetical protein CSUI_010365 [Cystoisospora suis]|uniref:Transmembrane protein n=1 Tax=Cystoisospora suis TaxID=483139 RepID=A0A2C6KH08_9APIC|nr:hypothetical protein CSUI_010365 [Cystoisospora suis]